MPLYEHVYLARQDLSTQQVEEMTNAYKAVIEGLGGKLVNPMIVEGLIMGGVAHGLGWCLTEKFIYDADGQLLTGTFMDYLPIRFHDMPELAIGHMESPTPDSELGAKGARIGGAR